jgi:hypothetical protein
MRRCEGAYFLLSIRMIDRFSSCGVCLHKLSVFHWAIRAPQRGVWGSAKPRQGSLNTS